MLPRHFITPHLQIELHANYKKKKPLLPRWGLTYSQAVKDELNKTVLFI